MTAPAPGLVTVFGGSGFVGVQLISALAREGWRIKAAVRQPALAGRLHPLGNVGQIKAVRCDITSREDVERAIAGSDAVVNLVGLLHEGPGARFQTVHVDGARNIAEAAAAAGVKRLIQISAIGADPNSPSAYARTKGEAEAAVRAAFPEAVILRPSIIFGNGDGFLNRFASMATISPALPLIGGGKTRFQPVHVGDVSEAIVRSLTREDVAGRTFELGGPAVMTFEEVLRYILRETRRERLLLPIPFMAARMIGSVAQLTSLIGVAPMLTRDQVVLLERDNVVSEGADGLDALGIIPTGVEAIAPSYLWRYRRGGQFAENPTRQGDAPLPA